MGLGAGRDAILFLCVGNSARSQMAEGLARTLAPPGTQIYSAGSAPSILNPFAVEAMREIGIDISSHHSKGLDEIPQDRIDTVITLCAEEVCPTFPRDVERHHWPFEDPSFTGASDEERLENFRRVRDQIRDRIKAFFQQKHSK